MITVIHVDVENNQARRHTLRAVLEGRNRKLEKYFCLTLFYLIFCFYLLFVVVDLITDQVEPLPMQSGISLTILKGLPFSYWLFQHQVHGSE